MYAIYLPKADGTGTLNLAGAAGEFQQRWYNPRTGEFEGDPQTVNGDGLVELGKPPREQGEDWAILIQSVAAVKKDVGELETSSSIVFPQKTWAAKSPAELGLDAAKLDELANMLGGRGCVVKNGYVVKTWGSQSRKSDWLSSAKPVLGTLLMFAMQEGLVRNRRYTAIAIRLGAEGKRPHDDLSASGEHDQRIRPSRTAGSGMVVQ